MSPRSDAAVPDLGNATPTAAQLRVIAAALELFARHGVGGTSLQMIADEIGVTKAAIYYQYKTKEEIVVAVAESELARLRTVITGAEGERSPRAARDAAVTGIVDLAVERGRKVATMLNDPQIGALFADHEGFLDLMRRLQRLLVGDDAAAQAPVRTAMIVAAISGAVMHPLVVTLDDEVLRAELRRLANRFLGPAR